MKNFGINELGKFMGSLRSKDPNQKYWVELEEIDVNRARMALARIGIHTLEDAQPLLRKLEDTGFSEEAKIAADEQHPNITGDFTAGDIAAMAFNSLAHVLGSAERKSVSNEAVERMRRLQREGL